MYIHATNITGVGASHVVTSFIDAASEMDLLSSAKIHLPHDGPLSKYTPKTGLIKRYKRYLPNSISRLVECLFASLIFKSSDLIIVLGDIPLHGIRNQVVLVHQPNLVYPSINKNSSRNLTYRIFRAIFKNNTKFVKEFIVQTQVMADELTNSYPDIAGRVKVVPQPVPSWFKPTVTKKEVNATDVVKLFYPAAGYPHKNHSLLLALNNFILTKNIENVTFKILLTLTEDEFKNYKHISFIENLGRLKPEQVLISYKNSDALLFLSTMESYGLPLVEGLQLGLPIICVDLPYARWMCESTAYYFNSTSSMSLYENIMKFSFDLKNGKQTHYGAVLSKFPSTWNDVVNEFIK